MNYTNPSNRIFLYKPGEASKKRALFGNSDVDSGAFVFTYAPLVSVNSTVIFDKTQSTYNQGTASTATARKDTITLTGYLRNSGITTASGQVDYILTRQGSLRNAVDKKWLTLEINDCNGNLLETFSDCNLVSLDFPEGNYVQYGQFTLVLERYYTANMTNGHIDYQWSFDVQTNTDMGYLNSSNNDIKSTHYLVGIENITASTDGASANVRSFVNSMRQFYGTAATVYLTGGNLYDVSNTTGTAYGVYNIEYSTSADVTQSTLTYTAKFILVPTDGYHSTQGLAKLSSTYESSADGAVGRLTGSIMGLRRGYSTTGSNDITNNAKTCYNAISGNAISIINGDVGAGIPTGKNRSAETVTKNNGIGTVDFSIEYETKSHQVANTTYERIEVTTNPSRSIFATIPVIGRSAGPILQDTSGNTEKTRDFMIEVVYQQGYGDSTGPGTITVQDSWKPTGTVFESSNSHTWNPSERRFIRRKSWVYT